MRIKSKLILVLTLLGIMLCLALYGFMQWSFDRGWLSYVNQEEKDSLRPVASALAKHYELHGSWQRLQMEPRQLARILRSADAPEKFLPPPERRLGGGPRHREGPVLGPQSRPQPRPESRPGPHKRPPKGGPKPLPALLDANKRLLVGRERKDSLLVPIELKGGVVGWLSVPQPRHLTERFNLSMRNDLDWMFLGLGLLFLAAIMAVVIPLSRHFVLPLKQLANMTTALAKGDYSGGIPAESDKEIKRTDEIGQLVRDFKVLANTLKDNEHSRSRWVADISHELRTPLAITLGEIEAMLEDVRPTTKDNLRSVKQEIEQLNRLVNDLHELSNAEIGALRYSMSRLDLKTVVSHGVQRFEDLFAAKSLQLGCDFPSQPVWIEGDIDRLNQLMNNLFTNEVKYADTGGQVRVALKVQDDCVQFSVEDSGPGVADHQLEKLFDHLYRTATDKKISGSGLGLSICKKIVAAHQGSVNAQHSSLGGLKLSITLPLSPARN